MHHSNSADRIKTKIKYCLLVICSMSLITNCTSTGKLTPEILENQVSIIFDEDLILGTITVEKTLVHLFYLGNIEKEKQRLYKKALKQAKKKSTTVYNRLQDCGQCGIRLGYVNAPLEHGEIGKK